MFAPTSFFFFLERELAAAERYGFYVSYLLFRIPSHLNGHAETARAALTSSLGSNIRATDYLGEVDDRTLGVILLNTTSEDVGKVRERLQEEARLQLARLPEDSLPDVAEAVYPTEANSTRELTALAGSRLPGPPTVQ